MTREQWQELVEQVNAHGPEKVEFEDTDGIPFDVEDVTYMTHEDAILVLLS